jgi:fructose-bisphosphate aldolase class I
MNKEMLSKFRSSNGFIAALDQSGGSTPKALAGYGITSFNDDEDMFSLIHGMRERVMSSSVFDGERISGAILFEDTLNRKVQGIPTAEYLWKEKGIIPFIKIDKGLMPLNNGCQEMNPIPNLEELLITSKEKGVFGTKMRSVIKEVNLEGIRDLVEQQFEIAKTVIKHGMVPIIEPEVDINAESRDDIEIILRQILVDFMLKLDDSDKVILKLTLPEEDNLYLPLVSHFNVLKVVALSGGYSRDVANEKLTKNKYVSASFSRALLSELNTNQSDDEFDSVLENAIESIYLASKISS